MNNTCVTTISPELADQRTARRLWKYGSPILIIIGSVNNILVLCVMLRRPLRGSVSCIYLSALAVLDLMCLYVGLLRQWITHTFGVDVRALSEGSCKVHPTLVYFALHFEAWILVNLTTERFTAVLFPIRSRSLFSPVRAAIGLGVTGVVTFVINTHYLPAEYYDDELEDCSTHATFYNFQTKVWPWLDLIIVCFLPFALMISMNLAVIWKIYKSNYRSKNKTRVGDSGNFKLSKVNQLTITLLVVSIAFFVTTLPLNIHLIIANLNYDVQDDLLDDARDNLIFAATSLVSYTNNALNFFLYCFSAKRFRRQLLLLLCKRNMVEPTVVVNTVHTIHTRHN